MKTKTIKKYSFNKNNNNKNNNNLLLLKFHLETICGVKNFLCYNFRCKTQNKTAKKNQFKHVLLLHI